MDNQEQRDEEATRDLVGVTFLVLAFFGILGLALIASASLSG